MASHDVEKRIYNKYASNVVAVSFSSSESESGKLAVGLLARRKVDASVLPLLLLGLLVFQLDRMNLASALTDGFARDIGVNQNTINLGNQLMFLGIVVLEIPSNLLLQRVCDFPSTFSKVQA